MNVKFSVTRKLPSQKTCVISMTVKRGPTEVHDLGPTCYSGTKLNQTNSSSDRHNNPDLGVLSRIQGQWAWASDPPHFLSNITNSARHAHTCCFTFTCSVFKTGVCPFPEQKNWMHKRYPTSSSGCRKERRHQLSPFSFRFRRVHRIHTKRPATFGERVFGRRSSRRFSIYCEHTLSPQHEPVRTAYDSVQGV